MRRLLKKEAWGTVELYHITNSQLFTMMYQDGQISPGVYTDRVSYGSGNDGTYRDVYKSSQHSPDQAKTYYLTDLIRDINDSAYSYTDELKQQLEEQEEKIKNDNPDPKDYDQVMENTQLQILEYNPPSGENGIYLSGKPLKKLYRSEIWENKPWPELPAFNVELKIKCEEDALGPDLDDGWINKNSDAPPWKQTLQNTDQCVHYGPISMDDVTGVYLDAPGSYGLDRQYGVLADSIRGLFDTYITSGQWISASEANNQYTEFYKEVVNLHNQENSYVAQNKTKRLKKKAD